MNRRDLLRLFGQGVCSTTMGSTAMMEAFAQTPPIPVGTGLQRAGEGDPSRATQAGTAVASARAVLTRLLGPRAGQIDLEWVPPAEGRAVYELSASGGRLRVRGSSGVAISRGAYEYLRSQCNVMVTWSGRHLALPDRFPDAARRRVACPYAFTQYLNVVTFGYTTAFWDWERWEKELDWMALHGVTMALAMTGQEAIWQRVWTSMGITQAELDRTSCGPAYLPWHWMGNINNFDGPLPQEWIARQRDLQRLILGRMRELGITPVAPAFAGFVPEGFQRIFPEAKITTVLWAWLPSIPRNTRVLLLHPDEAALYREVGRRFIQEYKREYGEVAYYLADIFNELEPPVDPAHRYEQLKRFALSVYNGIVAGDPNGRWVMQGWLFVSDRKFWDSDSIRAFVSGVPDDRLIIVDYSSDMKNSPGVWTTSAAFFGKPWMNGMVQNFGGNNNVAADLAVIAAKPAQVLNSPRRGKLMGWALCPEGLETNELAFELMTDVGWSQTAIDLETWIPAYFQARYGSCPAALRLAAGLLRQSVYGSNSGIWARHFLWQTRPDLEKAAPYEPADASFARAVELHLSCAAEIGPNELYTHDLIELAAQCLAVRIDRHLATACQAHRAGDFAARDTIAAEALQMLVRVDALLDRHPNRRLQPWVDAARRAAAGADELCYYDCDARRLLTYWGWSELNDYAARVWSGLIRDYYVGRWQLFFQGLREGHTVSMDDFEQRWLAFPYRPSRITRVENVAAEAEAMLLASKAWG